ncbi:MAG: type II toxin-antitoxin system Phd/YefM family antitoxin [Thermoanaerobaculia bacterium]
MAELDTLIPVSDLVRNTASVLRQVKESRKPVVITQEGRPEAVLFSIEVYQQIEAERAILTRLAQGEREIVGCQGYDLDHVLNEADAMLRLLRE